MWEDLDLAHVYHDYRSIMITGIYMVPYTLDKELTSTSFSLHQYHQSHFTDK